MNKEQEFVKILKDNQQRIHKICGMYTNTPEDCKDLVQEVILNIWKAYPSFEGYVKVERQLLKNVFYWYLLPLLPGMVLLMLGTEVEWSGLLFDFSILFVIFLAIYLLNQEAADKEFSPLLADIEKTLQNLE